ncbi:MAG TPA: TetR/AcrR family transcriptional regulator [Acidimicrobiales bacterium]
MAEVQTHRRRRSRRGEGERLREEILAAAQRLLVERGSEEAVSIRAIAAAVGVTPPSIYLHFPDKEELFLAVCDARFTELDDRSEAAARGASDALDEIRRRGEAYIRFGLDHPEQYRILFLDPQPPSMTAGQVEKWACLQHMVDAVQRAMDAGLVQTGDAFLVTLGLWASVHGLVSLLISKPELPWPPVDVVIDHVLDASAFGIAAR